MGSSKTTIGYRYFLGLETGICIGPVDAVTKIIAADRTAWTGSQAVSGNIDVHAPTLFGGDEKEGGLSGIVEVKMGEPTQTASSYLTGRVGGLIPANRGLLSLVFRGRTATEAAANSTVLSTGGSGGSAFGGGGGSPWRDWVRSGFYWSSLSPYIKPIEVVVRRILAGWSTTVWYSEKAQIGDDMNPAHIIYQCLTDNVWGMGRSTALIDTTSFTAAADQLFTEGFGLSLVWSQQTSIEDFLGEILRHIDGAIDTDLSTGQYTLKLIRNNYDPGTLPTFGPSEIVSMDRYERAAWGETINEVIVAYTDAASESETSVVLQDLANVRAQGGIVSETVNYPGIRSASLAYRVGERDLRARSTPLAVVHFTTNRKAWNVKRGDAIKVTWPDYELTDFVVRVTNIDKGGLADGIIKVEAVEDVFALPTTSYGATQPTLWQDPAAAPAAISTVVQTEVPYYVMAQLLSPDELAALPSSASYPLVMAQRPAGQNSLMGVYGSATAVTTDFLLLGTAPYTSTCLVNGAAAWNTTVIPFDTVNGSDPSYFVGGYAYWDGEWVGVTSVDLGLGTITLERGIFDSIPVPHADNTTIWFYSGENGFNGLSTDAVRGETVYYRETGRSISGETALSSAPQQTYAHLGNWARPYPPADVKINGAYFPATTFTNFTITWKGRNREAQIADLVGWSEGHIAPPSGVTYTLEVWNHTANTLLQRIDGLPVGATGGTYKYTGPGADTLRIVLYAKQAGLSSRQSFSHTATVSGYGYDYGLDYGGATLGIVLPKATTSPVAAAVTRTPIPVWLNGALYDLSSSVPMRSDDGGASWYAEGPSSVSPPAPDCTFVYGNGAFAAYNNSGYFWRRRAGSPWSLVNVSAWTDGFASGGNCNSITFDGSRFVMVRNEARDIYTSVDLETWTHVGSSATANNLSTVISTRKIIKVGDNYVATGSISSGVYPSITVSFKVATSTDLISWTGTDIPADLVGATTGAFFSGKYWALGQTGSSPDDYLPVIYSSTDFVTWTVESTGISFPPGLYNPRVIVSASQLVILFWHKNVVDGYSLSRNTGGAWTFGRPKYRPRLVGGKADPITTDAGPANLLIRVGSPLEFGGKLLSANTYFTDALTLVWPSSSPTGLYFGTSDELYTGSSTQSTWDKSGLRNRFATGGLALSKYAVTGKRYAEFTIVGFQPGFPAAGQASFILELRPLNGLGPDTGLTLYGNSSVDFAPGSGDVIGVLIDFTLGVAEIRVNNLVVVSRASFDTTVPWYCEVLSSQQHTLFEANVGLTGFTYPQAGYTAWNA